jgi:hypothetical protein
MASAFVYGENSPVALDLYRGKIPAGAIVVATGIKVGCPPLLGDELIQWAARSTCDILWCDTPVGNRDDFCDTVPLDQIPASTPYYIARFPGTGIFAFGKSRWGATLNLAKLNRELLFYLYTAAKKRRTNAVIGIKGAEDLIGCLRSGTSSKGAIAFRSFCAEHSWETHVINRKIDMVDHLKYMAVRGGDFDLAAELRHEIEDLVDSVPKPHKPPETDRKRFERLKFEAVANQKFNLAAYYRKALLALDAGIIMPDEPEEIL